jgi:hypothetical protein
LLSSSGPDKNCYYHEKFLRGKLFLARHIQRTSVKGTGPRRAGSIESQPNFYLMPFLPAVGTLTRGSNPAQTLPVEGQLSSGTMGPPANLSQESSSLPVASIARSRALGQTTLQSRLSTMPTTLSDSRAISHPSSAPSLASFAIGELQARRLLAQSNAALRAGLFQPSESHLLLPSSGSLDPTIPSVLTSTTASLTAGNLERGLAREAIASSLRHRQYEAMREQFLQAQIASAVARLETEAEDEERRRILAWAVRNGIL